MRGKKWRTNFCIDFSKEDMSVETPAGVALAVEILLKDIPDDLEILSVISKIKGTDVVCTLLKFRSSDTLKRSGHILSLFFCITMY